MKISGDALDRAKKVKLIIFDVDGVLTDGGIYHSGNGELFKAFHCRDGFGITLLHSCGIKTAIITGRTSTMTEWRAKELNISAVMQGQMNKRDAYKKIKMQFGLSDDEIAYVADDLIDLPVLVQVGFRAAVGDAAPEVVDRAHFVANNFGGRGAVREVIEFILKAKGLWQEIIERYTTPEFDDKELTALNR
ncbi:MAG: HAD hydrolase family protein [Selenomonadaceae bacterium]|nr:HAD hydrolase family protein [Selenomonadaceae bacterium]